MLTKFVDNAVDLVIAHDELTTFTADHNITSLLSNHRNSINSNDVHQPLDLTSTANGQQERNAAKRLSFRDSSDNSLTTNVLVDSIDQVDCSDRLFKTQQESRLDRRRSSLNRSLALTPLFNSSEYIPVYANRVMITNTISDDEKWQLLSRKRSDQLSGSVYQIGDDVINNSDRVDRMSANETVYALCRPHNKSQPLSISRSTMGLSSDQEPFRSDTPAPEDETIVLTNHSFPLQKSQTESCLPLATAAAAQSSATSNHIQQLYIQSVPIPDVCADSKCQQTISIQINDDGVSYVEGIFKFYQLICVIIIVLINCFRIAKVCVFNSALLQRTRSEIAWFQYCWRS